MLGFVPVPRVLEPRCPTRRVMGTIGVSDKCQWNHNIYGAEIPTRPSCLRNFCPHRNAETNFSKNQISWQKYTEKRSDPTEWITFLTYLKICGEKY